MISEIVNSFFSSVSYLIRIGHGVMIDCGDINSDVIATPLNKVLLTHAHYDHIYGLNNLLCISPATNILTNSAGKKMLLSAKENLSLYHDTPFLFDFPEQIVEVEDGEEIDLGNGLHARAIFTPGHNQSCITWIIDNMVFTGDSYIPGVKVVTNLPGGNKAQAQKSLERIKNLSKGKIVYPGHKISDR